MITRTTRKIIKIDEEKCDGCGVCIPACVEGALQIIGGKAKLVKEKYCDGLGACLGECPQGAITIEERESEAFDEEAAREHQRAKEAVHDELPCGCPSATVTQFDAGAKAGNCCNAASESRLDSLLTHWPVQLTLVPPGAPFLNGADVMLIADCVPFAYANIHKDFVQDHAVLVACPKLDNFQIHQNELTDLVRESNMNSLTVVHMEVPCCSGLVHMAKQAIAASGKDIPLRDLMIGIKGEIL